MRYKHAIAAAGLGIALVLTGCGDKSSNDGQGSSISKSDSFNNDDVSFAREMIPHHRQAVEMSQMASTRAGSAEVKALAAEIEDAQGPEIKTMTGWLKDWDQEVPEDGDMSMDSDMPGMMSRSDMKMLAGLGGAEFDETFLTMMVAHHEGAIEMAKTEQANGKSAEAVALAEEIEAAQAKEIKTMRTLLSA